MKIVVGEKDETKKYDFRETCFGICEKDGKIAVVYDKNQYSLIGGGIDEGETKEETILREFKEEVGYNIEVVEHLCTIDCFWLAGGKWPMESLANIFIINILDEIEGIEAESKLEFIELDKVVDLLPLPYHKKAIEYYLENRK